MDLTRRRLLAWGGNAAALRMLGGCESFHQSVSAAQPGVRHQCGRRGIELGARGRASERLAPCASGALRRHRAPHLRLLLGQRQPGQRDGARSLSERLAGEHRRDRNGAHGLRDRRRPGLHHARAGTRANARHGPVLPQCAARAAAGRRHRVQGIFLPFPRHEDRSARAPQRAVDGRHGAAGRRHAARPGLLRCRSSRRGGDPGPGRRDLLAHRLEMGAGAGRVRQHGLEARVGLHPARLAGLQRGDARGPARDGIAHPPGRRRKPGPPGPTATRAPGAASWATST